MTPKDRVVAYMQSGIKKQPFRTDSIVPNPQHLSSGSTLNQDSPSWVGKLEYNRTFGNRGFLEMRAGEFGYNFALIGNGTEPRREDNTTLQVTGGGRDWLLERRRKQAHGAYTFFVDDKLGGNHQFKVGGEVQHETGVTYWNSYYADNVVQLFNNNAASSVRLGLPVASQNGLRNYRAFLNDSFTRGRLTLNLGVRYDRYRVFLPEQERGASRFSPDARTFEAVDNVKTFNHFVPRLGVIYDLTGNGKTVLKANYGRYFFNPGVNLADAVNPNTSTQYTQYAWTDRNNDRRWQSGEEGAVQQQLGGTANVAIDPNLKNSHTDELSAWVERDVAGVGVRLGYVWKMDRDGYQQSNANRPFAAYNASITVVDPGPDGSPGTADDRNVSMMNLDPAALAVGTRNLVANPAGFEADYKSVELAVNKPFSNKYSVVASFLYTRADEFGTSYNGSGAGANGGTLPTLFSSFAAIPPSGFPVSPNDSGMRAEYSVWNFKAFGTYEPAWGLRITPVVKIQPGYPYGRVFNATATSGAGGGAGTNYGTQPLYAEPLTTHRFDTVKQVDLRAEKGFGLSQRVRLSLIFDVYNVFNANPVLNLRATTGRLTISETGANIPTFQTPITILPPRIARLSARLEF